AVPKLDDRLLRPSELADFTAVDLNFACDAAIIRGDAFHVIFNGGDPEALATGALRLFKEGPTLRLAGPANSKQKRVPVTITMPALSAITLDGSANATIRGFESDGPFQAKLGKQSVLQGTIRAGNVAIQTSGSS